MIRTEAQHNEENRPALRTAPPGRAGLIWSVLLNLAIAGSSIFGAILSSGKNGAAMFAFYTVDSNLLAALACALYAGFLLRKIARGREVPKAIRMLKYCAVCCLSVTFLVVIAVLAPMYGAQGYKMMLLSGDMLYHHLLSPILALLSFFLFDRVCLRPKLAALCALIPTALYAAILIVLNVAKQITGPYPFLHVYAQPVYRSVLWCILIVGGAYAVALLLAAIKRQKLNKI